MAAQFGVQPVVRRVEIEYLGFARHEDDLVLRVQSGEIGRSSCVLEYELTRADDSAILMRARQTLVFVNVRWKAARVPDWFRAACAENAAQITCSGKRGQMKRREFLGATVVVAGASVTGCRRSNQNGTANNQIVGANRAVENQSGRVTVYCSVDDVYARPILAAIEKRTGLKVDALYDTEAAKTAGLANKLRAEKARPRGDVFWSSALLQTLLLGREGLLQQYQSHSTINLSNSLQAGNNLWTAVGVRHRVIVAHASVKNPPRELKALFEPQWRSQVGISNPQFGTASDWVAALGTRWGVDKTRRYFELLKRNEVQVLAGNSVVAQRVARGELLVGVTDSDDYHAVHREDPNLKLVSALPPKEINSIIVPGSVAIISGAPHPKAARQFLDALLDAKTELQLSKAMPGVTAPRAQKNFTMPNDSAHWVAAWNKLRDPLAEILLK